MDKQEKQLPPPIEIARLKEHFKKMYNLNEVQIGMMLVSSAQSLRTTLEGIEEYLQVEPNLAEIAKLSHSLKGLLLNMGEEEWADIARSLELSAAADRDEDYSGLLEQLKWGAKEMLLFGKS